MKSSIINSYHIQDARRIEELLSKVGPITTTITSPPYWNLKDYGNKEQIGFGQKYTQYIKDLETVFKSIYRHTKPTGTLWIICDTFKQDGRLKLLPFDLANKLSDIGWILQDLIIWEKDRTLPWSHQGKLRNIFEYILFFSRSSSFKYRIDRVRELVDIKDYWVKYPERYNPYGKAPSRTWRIPIPRQGSWGKKNNFIRHVCPLPPELCSRIVHLSSDRNDLILDPFAGAGSVLAVAKALGRNFLGTDLSRRSQKHFQTYVLPNLICKGTQSTYRIRRHDDIPQNRSFTKSILQLRQLKYPLELLRLYSAKHERLKCVAIFAFPSKKAPCSPSYLIYLKKKSRHSERKVLARVCLIANKPPLSKYGLTPKFFIVNHTKPSLKRLRSRRLFAHSSVFVYQNGKFYQHARQLSLEEALAEIKHARLTSGKCPIFSTLKVSVARLPHRKEQEVKHVSK